MVRRPLLSASYCLLLALAVALPIFWRLGDEEFHGDETHWTTSGQQAFYLLTSGRLADPQWREEFYFYSQPQVGKLLIGAALALAGHYGPTPIREYDWQRKPAENRAAGRVPPPEVVTVARLPGAIAGWLACLLLWRIAARLGAPTGGALAAVLLAAHPLWLANSRRAGMDTTALCLGLLAVWVTLRALDTKGDRERRPAKTPEVVNGARPQRRFPIAWWLLAGTFTGLAAGAKYTALLALPPAIALAAYALVRGRERHAVIVGGTGALVAALAVFYAANPAFYGHPLVQFRVTLDFLSAQAEAMRRTMPLFASPPLVAAEIVDRAIWPTAFPAVRDLSLPEPLVPGSYGTPAVALGLGTALMLARRGRHTRGLPLGAAFFWCAAVFAALTLSVPTWWERWHLPLIPPLCLAAGLGLDLLRTLPADGDPATRAARTARAGWHAGWTVFLLAAAQYLAALALEPSFLGNGFGALVLSPVGAAAHLTALVAVLVALVSQASRVARARRPGIGTTPGGSATQTSPLRVRHGVQEVTVAEAGR